MDVKKILDEIDGLRERAEKSREFFDFEYYASSLRRNYPTLRDYIARLERESEELKTDRDRYREGKEFKLREMTTEENLSFFDGTPQGELEPIEHDMAEIERWNRYFEYKKREWLQ